MIINLTQNKFLGKIFGKKEEKKSPIIENELSKHRKSHTTFLSFSTCVGCLRSGIA
jgi:hypothetical protein